MSADANVPGLEFVHQVLDRLGVGARRVRAVGSPASDENRNWHVWPRDGERTVLRRYHRWATAEDLAYEHRLLDQLADTGWTVPRALSAPIEHDGRCFSLAAFVPGRARINETVAQRRQREIDPCPPRSCPSSPRDDDRSTA
jgi:Ser/Thr protein kinase RdoA (MazF antagonist)